jgi:hypothetical protein
VGKPWTQTFSGDDFVVAMTVDADAAGNVVVLGGFGQTVTVGTETFSGNRDYFLTKLDGCGNPIWQKGIGNSVEGKAVIGAAALDPSGNVLFAGTFAGPLAIDGVDLPALGGNDVVVARFDPGGKLLWAQRWGDAEEQYAHAVLALPDGHFIVGGDFGGTLQIGDETAVSTTKYNVFVAELSPDGAPVTDIFHFEGDPGATLYSMAPHPDGGVLVGLGYTGQPTLPVLPGTANMDAAVLLVKGGAGVPLGTIQGTRDIHPTGLAVHPGTGRIVVTGYFHGDFFTDDGNVTFQDDDLEENEYTGFVIANGPVSDPGWKDAYFFTGGRCFPRALAMEPVTGGAHVAGQLEGTVHFTGQAELETAQGIDPFVLHLPPEGSSPDSVEIGALDGDQEALSVALGPNEELFVAGAFASAIKLDGPTVFAKGPSDAFVFRYVAEP